MTEISDLLNECKYYLETYLHHFEKDEIDIDKDKNDFNSIYSKLESADLSDFIQNVSSMKNPLVIDIASIHGERFGLHIADKNPSSKVEVYNPDYLCKEKFPISRDQKITTTTAIYLDKTNVEFDPNDIQGSVNRLYKANNLFNINYNLEPIDEEKIQNLAKSNKNIVLYASRINELVEPLCNATKSNDNVDLVILPLLNLNLESYYNDETIQLINQYKDLVVTPEDKDEILYTNNKKLNPEDNFKTRTFTIMSLYFSLKAAEETNAKVYKPIQTESGFPYHQPNFIVSTIKPIQNPR